MSKRKGKQNRIPLNVRIDVRTREKIDLIQKATNLSQGLIVDRAIADAAEKVNKSRSLEPS